MDFTVTLTAKTSDEGGIKESFESQLKTFGGEATLIDTTDAYRVDSSDGFYFEVQRTYNIAL